MKNTKMTANVVHLRNPMAWRTYYPVWHVHHEAGGGNTCATYTKDTRYTIRAEACGNYNNADGLPLGWAWVARFCGTELAFCNTLQEARMASEAHNNGRMKGYL